MKPLSKFESLAQQLVEGSFNRLLGREMAELDIATRLARAVEDTQEGREAAIFYEIRLSTTDWADVTTQNPDLAESLADYILMLSQRGGLTLAEHPQVILIADPALSRYQVRINAQRQSREAGYTTELRPSAAIADEIMAAITAVDAYLIIEGRRHVPLNRPLINIGRRTDNDIVLDAAVISRYHAQIRWRYGRFVLYDLSNRDGRTLVNGQPVKESVLQSGDVITLSNIPLIYGEGQTARQARPSRDGDETQMMPKR
ncbi:MAG: DUF3662 domain-containing protein [Chloroflexi bacterium]|nr:DUF3662 domain-containing protein [Chloroflexota bacterium]